MSCQNLVSGELTDEQLRASLEAVKALDKSLDFLISLSPDARKHMIKLRADHVDFVHQMKSVCNQQPDFLPRQFELAEFDLDVALSSQLEQLETAISNFARRVEDTMMGVRSDMYAGALEAYNYLRIAKEGDGLDVHRRELGLFFKRKSLSPDAVDAELPTDVQFT